MEDATCSVCLEIYNDPVILSCSHNICRGCAARAMKSVSNNSKGLICPQCRVITAVSSPLELRSNIALRNIIATLQQQQKTQKASTTATATAINDNIITNNNNNNNNYNPTAAATTSAIAATSSSASASATAAAAAVIVDDGPTWIADELVNECTLCQKTFGIFRRRHHCRYCGNLFCDSCSKKTWVFDTQREKGAQRVCDSCHAELSQYSKKTQDPNTSGGSSNNNKAVSQLLNDADYFHVERQSQLWERLRGIAAEVQAYKSTRSVSESQLASRMDEHTVSIPIIAARVGGTRHLFGLGAEEVSERMYKFGKNDAITPPPLPPPGCCGFKKQFPPDDGEWFILAKEKIRKSTLISVVRNDAICGIAESDIVTGDIVYLLPGDRVPGDIRVIVCTPDARVDNTIITNNPADNKVKVSEKALDADPLSSRNILFFGTHIDCGEIFGIVYARGTGTVFGGREESRINTRGDVFDYCYPAATPPNHKQDAIDYQKLLEKFLIYPRNYPCLEEIRMSTIMILTLFGGGGDGGPTTAFKGAASMIRNVIKLNMRVVVVLPSYSRQNPDISVGGKQPEWWETIQWEQHQQKTRAQQDALYKQQQQQIISLCKAFEVHVPQAAKGQDFKDYAGTLGKANVIPQLSFIMGTPKDCVTLVSLLRVHNAKMIYVGSSAAELDAFKACNVSIARLSCNAIIAHSCSARMLDDDLNSLAEAIQIVKAM